MRALIDFHHADLFYSLQLLFEDRLGVEVYTPVGHEWWDEGYWQFGRWAYGDDRLAQQFLVGPENERTAPLTVDFDHPSPGGGTLAIPGVIFDPAHPERPIRTVTLHEFRQMDWAYIVASVDDNERGFSRLAKEVGAQYVLQVGNTNQQVDWSLDPLALSSSEMPIRGRGVVYHQEFNSDGTFRFADPALFYRDPVISSFVNLMPLIDCGPVMARYQETLPDFQWNVHGIHCPDGIVKPVHTIAAVMSLSMFGWHDKVTGDGFGHVIHAWAAIGRPIIGHASHYRGKMAEVFWTPETSIDLDKGTFEENVALIRAIASDPDRHAAMCHRMREVFDANVDYLAEGEAIASLLGIKTPNPELAYAR